MQVNEFVANGGVGGLAIGIKRMVFRFKTSFMRHPNWRSRSYSYSVLYVLYTRLSDFSVDCQWFLSLLQLVLLLLLHWRSLFDVLVGQQLWQIANQFKSHFTAYGAKKVNTARSRSGQDLSIAIAGMMQERHDPLQTEYGQPIWRGYVRAT